ncbi:Retrotransposon Gag-like protein 6 [Anabarilius grahami]|uniref:Retrotransposon Gag-like protein 6 n=1 Tax=Anabarilius grahami TaxID=495550 RepID=A0A3N0YQ71_ANAGA|nr:Retrotransposon Gag-like protein 6 [Anabarilius grahami]
MNTPDPFQELVDVLRRALSTYPPASSPASTPSPPAISSPMAKPVPFSGSAEDCNGFLLQRSLVLEMQPHLYPNDHAKVAFIISQLNGKARHWAEPLWSQKNPITQSLSSFIAHFKEVFGRPVWDSSIGEQLYQLKQGSLTVNEYALQFRTLAAASGWKSPS